MSPYNAAYMIERYCQNKSNEHTILAYLVECLIDNDWAVREAANKYIIKHYDNDFINKIYKIAILV
jgi:hypothetical protein